MTTGWDLAEAARRLSVFKPRPTRLVLSRSRGRPLQKSDHVGWQSSHRARRLRNDGGIFGFRRSRCLLRSVARRHPILARRDVPGWSLWSFGSRRALEILDKRGRRASARPNCGHDFCSVPSKNSAARTPRRVRRKLWGAGCSRLNLNYTTSYASGRIIYIIMRDSITRICFIAPRKIASILGDDVPDFIGMFPRRNHAFEIGRRGSMLMIAGS